MRRGIVMAEGPRGLVVLTPDGEFVEVPGRSGAMVGEEIGFEELPRRRTAWHRRFLLTVSAAVVLLLVAVGLARLPVFDGPKVAAYVAIDINPSVEIGVDRHRAVVELHALNEDGERVIAGLEYRKKPIGEVAAAIIRNAEAEEYLRDGGEVFVTSMAVSGVDAQFEDELVREIDRAVHKATLRAGDGTEPSETGMVEGQSGTGTGEPSGSRITEPSGSESGGQSGSGTEKPSGSDTSGQTGSQGAADLTGSQGATEATGGTGAAPKSEPAAASGRNIAVTIVRAPDKLRETAQANGVSPGKMAVYLLAEKKGLPISLDELKQGSIRQAVEPYGGIAGVLGDGRSDEERKRDLAEQLEKGAGASSRDGSANPSHGKSASAGNGKKSIGEQRQKPIVEQRQTERRQETNGERRQEAIVQQRQPEIGQ